LSDTDALIESLEQLITKKRHIKQGAMQELLTGKKRLPGFSGEWEVKRLADIAEVRDGTHQTPKYVESGVPFFSVENVTSGDFTNTKFISEAEHRFLTKSFKIEKGDILMTRIGSIGDCKLIDWDVDASFYVSLALLKIRKGYSPSFMCHYSNSALFKKEVDLNSLQSAIPRKINLGPISNVKVEIPKDLTEQTAIATILSDMDTEITTLETKLAKTRQLKQGMMHNLLTGKIRLNHDS
jgi:type I restriction enzyme S subunit